jgi:hypothetical protein
MSQPAAARNHGTLKDYLEHEEVPHGYWSNFDKFMVSLLKAWLAGGLAPKWALVYAGRESAEDPAHARHATRPARGAPAWGSHAERLEG